MQLICHCGFVGWQHSQLNATYLPLWLCGLATQSTLCNLSATVALWVGNTVNLMQLICHCGFVGWQHSQLYATYLPLWLCGLATQSTLCNLSATVALWVGNTVNFMQLICHCGFVGWQHSQLYATYLPLWLCGLATQSTLCNLSATVALWVGNTVNFMQLICHCGFVGWQHSQLYATYLPLWLCGLATQSTLCNLSATVALWVGNTVI